MLVSLECVLARYGISFRDEDGQGLVEYVLIIALIAILVLGGLAAVQGGISGKLTQIAGALT